MLDGTGPSYTPNGMRSIPRRSSTVGPLEDHDLSRTKAARRPLRVLPVRPQSVLRAAPSPCAVRYLHANQQARHPSGHLRASQGPVETEASPAQAHVARDCTVSRLPRKRDDEYPHSPGGVDPAPDPLFAAPQGRRKACHRKSSSMVTIHGLSWPSIRQVAPTAGLQSGAAVAGQPGGYTAVHPRSHASGKQQYGRAGFRPLTMQQTSAVQRPQCARALMYAVLRTVPDLVWGHCGRHRRG